MKKLSTIIMALALVLGMSQCKKQETPTSATPNANPGVHITVKVGDQDGKDDNGEKHNIAPQYGLFAFTEDDTLYVGHNGKYVGCLKYTNGFFDGTIYPDDVTGQPLHFYFLGGKGPKNPTSSTTTYNISIADQRANLPVLSYGASNELYTGPNNTYSTTLKNKCALVRINLLTPTTDAITLSSVPTEATIDFVNNAITPTNTTGAITLYGEEGVSTHRWAILLPGTNLSNSNCNVIWEGAGNMPAIGNNTYVNAGIGEGIQIQNQIVVELPNANLVVKDKNNAFSEFTVSSTGKKVYFSRANLKCDTENTDALVWSFHENQWDECFGVKTGSSSEPANQGSSVNMTNSSVMDRFSWGLHGSTTTGETDFVGGSKNLNRIDGTDWGCALTGEGNNHWRTLTAEEWDFLLNDKDETGNITGLRGDRRFLKACIEIAIPKSGGGYYTTFVNGLFIAPDNFDPTDYGYIIGHTTNDDYAFVADNQWNDPNTLVDLTSGFMEMGGKQNKIAQHLFYAGCVFLPGVGYRTTMYMNYYYYHDCYHLSSSFEGYYWSATAEPVTAGVSSNPYAHALKFTKAAITYPFSDTRDRGMCVRLVWDAN